MDVEIRHQLNSASFFMLEVYSQIVRARARQPSSSLIVLSLIWICTLDIATPVQCFDPFPAGFTKRLHRRHKADVNSQQLAVVCCWPPCRLPLGLLAGIHVCRTLCPFVGYPSGLLIVSSTGSPKGLFVLGRSVGSFTGSLAGFFVRPVTRVGQGLAE